MPTTSLMVKGQIIKECDEALVRISYNVLVNGHFLAVCLGKRCQISQRQTNGGARG